MSRARRARRAYPRSLRFAAAAGVTGVSLVVTGAGVFAALNAQAYNATNQAVDSGTLKLALADNGAGFTQAVSGLAPGDTVNRFVDVTNSGSLAGQALTLGVTDASQTRSVLTTDATRGLHASVSVCANGTYNTSTGACSGTETTPVNNAALSALATTPASVVSGSLAASAVLHLKVSLGLPDQTETTVNGTPSPSPSAATIQGLTASLRWTFSEAQRTAATTTG